MCSPCLPAWEACQGIFLWPYVCGHIHRRLSPPPLPLDKTFLWRTIVAPSLTFGAGVVLLRPEDVTELDRFQGRRLNALGSLANFRWLGEGGRISPPPLANFRTNRRSEECCWSSSSSVRSGALCPPPPHPLGPLVGRTSGPCGDSASPLEGGSRKACCICCASARPTTRREHGSGGHSPRWGMCSRGQLGKWWSSSTEGGGHTSRGSAPARHALRRGGSAQKKKKRGARGGDRKLSTRGL